MPESVNEFKNWISAGTDGWKAMDTILDTLDALVLVLDKQGKVVLFNKACSDLTGYSFEEVKGRYFYDLFLIQEEMEAVRAAFEHLSSGMFPNKHENYWVTRNKDLRWISWSNSAFTDENGEVNYIVGTGIDLTEQLSFESKLKESEQNFRMIVDFTYDCEQWVDHSGKLSYISPACRRISGYDQGDFYSDPKLFEKILHPDDRQHYLDHVEKYHVKDAPVCETQFRVISKQGETKWISHGCQSVFNDQGEWLGRRASNRDDTQRKNAELNALRSEREAQKKNDVMNAINTVLLETLSCETDAEVAQICLREAEKLTGSKFGFIGEINRDGLFDTIALSNPGWDTCNVPESEAVALIHNMKLRGLWSVVLETKAPFIANDPLSHPQSVGLPKGHPPLNRFLGTPLKSGEKTFGMCALGNKNEDYNEDDIRAMESLSVAFVQAVHRKRAERQLLEERKQLLSIFDGLTEIVYVSDPETYEILFMNQALKDIFGDSTGKICYQVFQGFTSPCEFCTNDLILNDKPGEAYVWEFYNENAARWFRCVDKAIRWPDGRMVRYELAVDITELKEAEEAIRRSTISRQLVGDMFRDLQKNSSLRDGDMFNAGFVLASRVDSTSMSEFLTTFLAMGMGELTLEEMQEDQRRWIFSGQKLMEMDLKSNQPTGHYTRGFLCGAVSRVAGASRVVGVETNCQSMGDEKCRFVVQMYPFRGQFFSL